MANRDMAFNAMFYPKPETRGGLKKNAVYPSRCCQSHPEVGYFGNEWPGDDERCPVCRLLDYIASEASR